MTRKAPSSETIRRRLIVLEMMTPIKINAKKIHSVLTDQHGISVSYRRVQSDLKSLITMFPERIEVDDRDPSYGFYYSLPKHARKHSAMSPSEAVCLQLAFDYLTPLLPHKALDPMTPYLKEASMVLKETQSTKMKQWKSKVLVIHEGLQLHAAKNNPAILEIIQIALFEGKAIAAKYQSKMKNFPSHYVLHPGGLVYRGRLSYLICAFDNDHSKIIYLPLHRFKEVEMLEDNSALKNKKVAQLAKGLLGFKLNEKNIRVILKFSRMAGSHLSETPLSTDQKLTMTKDGFIKITASVTDDMELRFWIRAFGDSVEVIAPAKLRKEFKEISNRMKKLYE